MYVRWKKTKKLGLRDSVDDPAWLCNKSMNIKQATYYFLSEKEKKKNSTIEKFPTGVLVITRAVT